MATVQISQTTPQPPLQFSSTDDLKLRAWYTNDFIAADGVTAVLGWSGQGEGFYYNITCSVNGSGFLVIPAFDVQPTPTTPITGFFGQLYVNGAPRDVIFGYGAAGAGWQVPTIYGSVISFDELVTYNSATSLLMPPVTFPTFTQMIAEIQRLAAGVQTYAGVGILGLTQLTTAPDVASVPIAFGSNDPAVGDIHGSLTANRVPAATDTKTLHDSQITDDGTDVGIQTLDYVQMGDFQIANHGSRIEVNDNFSVAKLLAGGGPAPTPANQYAGLVAQCGDTSAEAFVQTTGQTNFYGNGPDHESFMGDAGFDNNGTTVRVYDTDQMVSQAARNTAPVDANIFVEEICWFLDQAGGKLKARIRLDDGTYATWEGAYTPD